MKLKNEISGEVLELFSQQKNSIKDLIHKKNSISEAQTLNTLRVCMAILETISYNSRSLIDYLTYKINMGISSTHS